MGFFGRLLGKAPDGEGPDANPPPTPHTTLPEWAAHFKGVAQLNIFEAKVADYFRKRSTPARIDDGYVWLAAPGQEQRQYGLSNVSQTCLQREEWEWTGLIAQHFDAVERTRRLHDDNDPKFSSFDWCAPRLVPRFFEGVRPEMLAAAVTRSDIPGLTTVLAIDLPEAVKSVTSEKTRSWPGSPDDWFALANENAKRLAPLSAERLPVEEGELFAAQCADQIAGWALSLSEVEHIHGPFGALVSMPTKSLMLAAPFLGLDVIALMQPLMAMTAGAHRDGPGSLSANIYWVRDGRWVQIPWTLDESGFSVTPPPEFVEVLNSLAPDDPTEE